MTSPRRLFAIAAAAIAASAVMVPTAGAAGTCRPKGSQTVKATSKVRVFTRANDRRGWEKLYACRRRGHRTVTLATRYPDGEGLPSVAWNDDLVRIRGNFAAIPVVK